MGEIKDFVKLYIEDSDLLEDSAKLIAGDLQKNMRSNLWKGHGYDTGQLYRDIYSKHDVSKNSAIVIGGFTVEHGDYVIRGVRGKGKAKAGKIDFLNKGLEKTVEMYR